VLTQTQLERLLANTPGRTLRYRTERLTRLGLVGRSRPYREKGSAPFHYWPTRGSDAFVRGEPLPRGGERAEPNPQFLQHAERLSELYVLLTVQAPTVGLHLQEFKREGAGREAFRVEGRERALAPDALIHLRDDNGRGLLGFVEFDLGTMSHTRLKTKAAGYAAYAAQAAWTERHPFSPCLLFLTTTEARAISFLKILAALLDRRGRGGYYGRRRGYLDWFAAAACSHARDPERALVEACWDDLTLAGGGLTLSDCLNKARAAYDATRAKKEAEQRALEIAHRLARLEQQRERRRSRRTELIQMAAVEAQLLLLQIGTAGLRVSTQMFALRLELRFIGLSRERPFAQDGHGRAEGRTAVGWRKRAAPDTTSRTAAATTNGVQWGRLEERLGWLWRLGLPVKIAGERQLRSDRQQSEHGTRRDRGDSSRTPIVRRCAPDPAPEGRFRSSLPSVRLSRDQSCSRTARLDEPESATL
jgi:protein involved in plasmid replication-relaxation